ncbi:sugar ABC transporter substrate-binding protein [Streptomyces sp. TRM 70361]|uniref:ABC transporter substrate-binding protein n=1 Tax=Streptomyces sp. TRM 70361 TaxID=3116553 RepID=UPI002E7C2263|nr:sugar ABC transporter substrate-binding protein [Streptomyces sp. TRM 70361]MEE1938933.1 sugar ABC transporter substrate-binding protein [Streptomyces sp. TRM 70361]
MQRFSRGPRSRRTRGALALLVSGALITTASGCGGEDSSADSDAPLEVWTRSAPDPAATYKKIFAAFTEKTGIKVNYQPVVEFDKQLQSRASSKNLPDVMINDSGSMGTYQSQGLLLPVDRESIAGQDDISEDTWKSTVGLDGDHYGIPFSRQAQVTLIRKDWREKVGHPVPETWEDLAKLAEAFTTEDPDGNGKDDTYGMVVPGSTERGYLSWWASSYVWQGGGSYVEEAGDGKYRAAVDSSGSVKAVNWIKEQFCEKRVQPGALTANTMNAPHFQEGTAGIYHTGAYYFIPYDKRPGKEKYEVIAPPAGPGGVATLAEGENIYFGAGSKKTEAQKKLAEFLISPEAQQLGMKTETQAVVRLPVNTTLDAAEVLGDDRWKVVQDMYENSSHSFPEAIDFTPIRQSVAEGLNKLFADCGSDVEAGLKQLAETVDKELESQDLLP